MRERGNVLVIVGVAVTGLILVSGLFFALVRLRSTESTTSTSSRATEPTVMFRLPPVATRSGEAFGKLLNETPIATPSVTAGPTAIPASIYIQPTLTAVLSSDKKTVTVTFDALSGVRRVTYSVSYPTSSGDKGANGSFDAPSSGAVTRDITLGTCSSGGACSYDTVTGTITVRAVFTPIFGVAVEIVKTVAYQ